MGWKKTQPPALQTPQTFIYKGLFLFYPFFTKHCSISQRAWPLELFQTLVVPATPRLQTLLKPRQFITGWGENFCPGNTENIARGAEATNKNFRTQNFRRDSPGSASRGASQPVWTGSRAPRAPRATQYGRRGGAALPPAPPPPQRPRQAAGLAIRRRAASRRPRFPPPRRPAAGTPQRRSPHPRHGADPFGPGRRAQPASGQWRSGGSRGLTGKKLSPPEGRRAGGAERGEETGQSFPPTPLPEPRRHISAEGPSPQGSPEPNGARAQPANSSRGSGAAAWSAAASRPPGPEGPLIWQSHLIHTHTHTPA